MPPPLLLLLLLLLCQQHTCAAAAAAAPIIITWSTTPTTTRQLGWLKPNQLVRFTLTLALTNEDVAAATLLPVISPSLWKAFSLTRSKTTPTTIKFTSAMAKVPPVEGTHTIVWLPGVAEITVQVSCSDGNLCNGMERLVVIAAGPQKKKTPSFACRAAKSKLCDDGNACTKDACSSASGQCTFSKPLQKKKTVAAACRTCRPSQCKPKCTGTNGKKLECGFDGCFGECGSKPCAAGTMCIKNKCQRDDGREGTCLNAINLTRDFQPLGFVGTIVKQVPMHQALHVIVPRCARNSDDAGEAGGGYFAKLPEIVYRLDFPKELDYTALEVRTTSSHQSTNSNHNKFNTTLVIIEAENTVGGVVPPQQLCLNATLNPTAQWACSIDTTGDMNTWSQSATWMLKPGFSYFVVVERAALTTPATTAVTAQFKLVRGCTPNCSEKQCGESGCPGVDCGACTASSTVCVEPAGVCAPCVPVCNAPGTTCGGSDHCGGVCYCDDDDEADDHGAFSLLTLPRSSSDNNIKAPGKCNPLLPQCHHIDHARRRLTKGCSKPQSQFCSPSCECVDVNQPLPDLTILPFNVTVDDKYKMPDHAANQSCAVQEGCISGTGRRRLLRFDTQVYNQGRAAFKLPNPPEKYNDMFEFAKCHGHWHLMDFLLYELVAADATSSSSDVVVVAVVARGEKRSFCVMDSSREANRANVPCEPKYTCANQGLSAGWSDMYDKSLDCQFIDATNVPPGSYRVRQCVNWKQRFVEASFENNCIMSSNVVVIKPYECDCPKEYIGDGICDEACDVAECEFDGGDCLGSNYCGPTAKCWRPYIGDGTCDVDCLFKECDMDGGDCEW